MKHLYTQIRLTALLLLICSACSQDEVVNMGGESEPFASNALAIQSVEVSDFTPESGTRVSNDGSTVTFENGDQMGVLLIDDNDAGYANVLFTYNGSQWVNTDNVAYSSAIKRAIAYFPYYTFTDIPSTVDELKTVKMQMNDADASLAFKDKDLLVSEIADVASSELAIAFEHAFSLLTFSGKMEITVGDETISYYLNLSNVAFALGDTQYTPDEVEGGRYSALINEDELVADDFRYFYTLDGTSYVKTVSATKTLASNYNYTFPCSVSSSTDGVAVGDFYCTTASNAVVILSGNASAIPDGLTCKGIVFYVMDDEAFGSFAETNGLTAADYAGYEGAHGLMVSLINGGSFGTAGSGYTTAGLATVLASISGYQATDVSNGYVLTKAIQAKVADGTLSLTFTALNNHTDETVTGATSWYLPSFNELRYLVQGASRTTGSTAGQEEISEQLGKVAGTTTLGGSIPSVSFYESSGFRLMTSGTENGWHGTTDMGEAFRPICAF